MPPSERAHDDDRQVVFDQRDRAVLELAGGETLGVHIGKLAARRTFIRLDDFGAEATGVDRWASGALALRSQPRQTRDFSNCRAGFVMWPVVLC
jgi:hypothetical protein